MAATQSGLTAVLQSKVTWGAGSGLQVLHALIHSCCTAAHGAVLFRMPTAAKAHTPTLPADSRHFNIANRCSKVEG